MNKELYGAVDRYISDLFQDEDDSLKQATKDSKEANIPAIAISPTQGKLLQVLARLCNAKKILEIGTLSGYSTIWMAKALPNDGKLVTLELDPKHAAVAGKNIQRAGLDKIVEIRLGKALDLLPQLVKENAGPFDMIFIDADKIPYTEYFQWSLKLSRPGTLIIADNVVREGKVLQDNPTDEMVIGVKRFNEALAGSPEVTATILQTIGAKEHDGMAIAVVNKV